MTRWVVRDRVLHSTNGNGIWERTLTRLGAWLVRERIYSGRFRSGFYTVPARGSLIVERRRGR